MAEACGWRAKQSKLTRINAADYIKRFALKQFEEIGLNMKTLIALAISVAMSLAVAPAAFAGDYHCEERGGTKTAQGSVSTLANDADVVDCEYEEGG